MMEIPGVDISRKICLKNIFKGHSVAACATSDKPLLPMNPYQAVITLLNTITPPQQQPISHHYREQTETMGDGAISTTSIRALTNTTSVGSVEEQCLVVTLASRITSAIAYSYSHLNYIQQCEYINALQTESTTPPDECGGVDRTLATNDTLYAFDRANGLNIVEKYAAEVDVVLPLTATTQQQYSNNDNNHHYQEQPQNPLLYTPTPTRASRPPTPSLEPTYSSTPITPCNPNAPTTIAGLPADITAQHPLAIAQENMLAFKQEIVKKSYYPTTKPYHQLFPTLGADDIMPLLTWIVIHVDIPNLLELVEMLSAYVNVMTESGLTTGITSEMQFALINLMQVIHTVMQEPFEKYQHYFK